jgi:hypothetical protein
MKPLSSDCSGMFRFCLASTTLFGGGLAGMFRFCFLVMTTIGLLVFVEGTSVQGGAVGVCDCVSVVVFVEGTSVQEGAVGVCDCVTVLVC